ncbi:MAG: helix-turn-helix transcriptional regulator [Rhodocyclales bacterium]|nr:helix-turn-helix transcriptional regulator [Rhodocyclales bacterium]
MIRRAQAEPSLFARRLREARLRLGISQMQLGIEAGVDEYSASARINQYERGKHMPDMLMVRHLARVLDVPTAYFFAESDEEAQVLTGFHWLNAGQRKQVMKLLRTLLAPSAK